MKKILILCFTKLQHDARVSRQVEFLKRNYHVTVAVYAAHPDPQTVFIELKRPNLSFLRKAFLSVFLLLRQHRIAYRLLYDQPSLKQQLKGQHFDLIIANDVETLPLAFALAGKSKVLFDAHEYAPRHFEDKLSWRIFFKPLNQYLCSHYIPRVAAMTTVGTGLAKEYKAQFFASPVIITNATWYSNHYPTAVKPDTIRMIHHGGATVSRQLEGMIEVMKHLDHRFHLDFMLIVPEMASPRTKQYIDHLKSIAAEDPRIRFLPPVRSHEIVETINSYDIGIFLIPPINFNYANTLPNKIFDFIQARLAVAIGPTPEMAAIVREYNNGVVSDTFSPISLAEKLNALSHEDVMQMKVNSGAAAQNLNAEKNRTVLLGLIAKII